MRYYKFAITIRCALIAKGPEAEEALIAFRQLAEDNFGETEEVAPPTLRPVPPVSGKPFIINPVLCTVQAKSTLTVEEEQNDYARPLTSLLDLMTLTAKAETSGLDDIAAIFSGHHTLLDDPELQAAASELLQHEHCTAEYAWQQVLKELSFKQYQQLDDEYLQARYIDVDDLLHRTAIHYSPNERRTPAV